MVNIMKSRFCPSPTGMMHLGNTRTALFNALLARKDKGVFLLRIEDTDQVRSELRYTNILLDDLQWLGLNWQEGPYHQSERQAVYDKYYKQLEAEGLAYPCFCSEEQLALQRKVQLASGKPPRYAGGCCNLSKEEIAAKIAAGEKPTLRFRVPETHEIIFHDLVHGEQHFNSDDIGDFIIRRANGTSSFMFCNAIDDSLMHVTHALRGEDHLTNTPRQIMILRALNLSEPQYGHISLIMGSDGAPLSKRNGSRSLRELRDEGFLPEALLNYLARLGHRYEQEHYMSLDDLAANFNVDNLGKSPARFDNSQLIYWQKHAVAGLDQDNFWDWLGAETKEFIPAAKLNMFFETAKANWNFPAEIANWAKILFAGFDYDEEQKAIIKDAGILFFDTALKAIEQHGAAYIACINELKQHLSISGKALFMPLRIALTGERHGPEMAHVFELLGAEQLKLRLMQARTQLHG